MDAAAYGVIGACFGAGVTGIVSVFSARSQERLKVEELKQQEATARRELAAQTRKEKAQRYARFLSAFWQEERFVSEMIEHLSTRRPGWSDEVRRINTSQEHHRVVATLNESMGWLAVLCSDPIVERDAAALNAEFDRMMERFGIELSLARSEQPCDTECVRADLARLRDRAQQLSRVLRADLGISDHHDTQLRVRAT